MNIGDVLNGFRVDALVHLDGDQNLMLGYFLDANVEQNNHNIFRLDEEGNVMWQVQRDEQGKLNWEAMHQQAKQRGEEGCREPFGDFVLIYADGSNNGNPKTGIPPETAQWVPGCTIRMRSFSGQLYDLDIEAGVARNITPGR